MSQQYTNLDLGDVRVLNNNQDFKNSESSPNNNCLELLKSLLKFTIIGLSTCLCLYLLYERFCYYVKFETVVGVNVQFMQQLRDILPGITVCSGSFMSLKSLITLNPKVGELLNQITSQNLTFEEEYLQKQKVISAAVKGHLDSLTLTEYFDPKNGLVTSQSLITYLMCDSETWADRKTKLDGLGDHCFNVLKIRTIDQNNGLCVTLFHESALIAINQADDLAKDQRHLAGRDELIDRKVDLAIASGFYTAPSFPGNGLLTLKLNFNFESIKIGPNQSTSLDSPYGGKFWIHSNRLIPKMSTTGFRLQPGIKYSVYIRKSVDHLMLPPYQTMCRNYTQEYKTQLESKDGHLMDLSIAISRDSCIDQCIATNSVTNATHCGCWPPALPFSKVNVTQFRTGLKFCQNEKSEVCYSMFEAICRSQCPNDCKDEHYETIIKEKPNPSKLDIELKKATMSPAMYQKQVVEKLNEWQPETIVEIIFATNEETNHEHSAALELISLLVDMAGLFGLFLALSAVHLIDLFEYIRDLVRSRKRIGINNNNQ